jgi:hypothetical protein
VTYQLPSTITRFISPCAPPLETIKGRGGQRSQGLDFLTIILHHPGPGNELPLLTSLQTLLRAHLAQAHDNHTLDVGYYSSEARTSINLVVSRANHPRPTHDRHKFSASGREPRHYLFTTNNKKIARQILDKKSTLLSRWKLKDIDRIYDCMNHRHYRRCESTCHD